MKKIILTIAILLTLAPMLYGADTKISALSTVNPAAVDLMTGLQGGANVNYAWGANLVALKGLTFADASIIQLTGAGAAAVLTSGGNDYFLKSATDNTALMFATPAEVRTALGLVVGTNVQAYDADLTYLAGFTPSDNVKTVLNAANNAAIKTALGYLTLSDVGTMAAETATNYVTKALYDADTILYATTDNTPVALSVTEQTVVGRVTGGHMAAIAIDSDLSGVSGSDDTIPSAKATKAALDGKVASASAADYTEPTEVIAIGRTGAGTIGKVTHTPVIDDADNFDDNFTGGNLYGGTFISNAAGSVILPNATVDMNFTIVLETTGDTIIEPLATGTDDTIYMNGLAAAQGESIHSTTRGAMCIFQYRAADTWMATCNGFAEATPP